MSDTLTFVSVFILPVFIPLVFLFRGAAKLGFVVAFGLAIVLTVVWFYVGLFITDVVSPHLGIHWLWIPWWLLPLFCSVVALLRRRFLRGAR